MCWQCVTPPDKYLPDARLLDIEMNTRDEYPAITIEWCGKVFSTNPRADWLFAGKALPGDSDVDGIPFFIPKR